VTEIYRLAIRFADLWAVDHHQMVDEIYAPTIHMESMARLDRAAVEGSEQLHALEDGLAAMIPEHRHELVRVVVGDRLACLETTVVGPTTGEYAPACVWWWPDDRGQVGAEVGWFDWNLRTTDSGRSHGHIPRNDHRPRGDQQWYRSLVEAVLGGLATDPGATADQWFAPDCVVERVGHPPCVGIERAGPMLPSEHWIAVNEVAADGGVVAVLFACGTSELLSRGTAVLTLDVLNRVVSVRAYWSWSTALSFEFVHPSIRLNH
jgi:hypothetical protein